MTLPGSLFACLCSLSKLHLWLFVAVNCLFSFFFLIILCLCGLVSPPLLVFVIAPLSTSMRLFLHFSCPCDVSNFPLSSSHSSFFFSFFYFFPPLFLSPHRLSPPPLQLPFLFSSLFFHTLHHLSLLLLPALSGISLWRWIWSQCVSTAMNACRTTWNADWPSVNATQKRRRRHWYPCVCDPLFLLSPHFHCSSLGQFPSSFLSVSIFLLCHRHHI